jgi:hypothetical protein
VSGRALGPGDGAAIADEPVIELAGQGEPAEALVFDLP